MARPAAAVGRAPLLQLLLDDLVQVEGDRGAGTRVAGVGQQPLHDVREALDLRERDRRLLLHRVQVVGDGDLLQAHGEGREGRTELVRGVGGQAPLGGQHAGDPLGAGVEDVRDAVQLGHPVAAVAGAGVARAEALRGGGEVGERGREPVGLAHGEQDRGDDGEQRHPGDDQQGAADLAGDGGARLLDGDRLALLALGGGLDDVPRGALPDLDGGALRQLDPGVPVGADLVPQDRAGDLFVTEEPASSTMLTSRTASESTRSWALLVIVRVSTMTSETPKTAITTSTTASVELIRRRRIAVPVRQLFSKRKPTPRTVAM